MNLHISLERTDRLTTPSFWFSDVAALPVFRLSLISSMASMVFLERMFTDSLLLNLVFLLLASK